VKEYSKLPAPSKRLVDHLVDAHRMARRLP